MKVKMKVYSADGDRSQPLPLLLTKEFGATDHDEARKKGLEILEKAKRGRVRSMNWLSREGGEPYVLVAYVTSQPPQRREPARGWRFRRPPA